MNIGSAIILLVILGLLFLAIRHIIRHGTCDHCDGACCHNCGSCKAIPDALKPKQGNGK